MKFLPLFFVCWVTSSAVFADVYRCVNAQGKMTLSDVSGPGCQLVQSRPTQSYAAPKYQSKQHKNTQQEQDESESARSRYRSVKIMQPKNGTTFNLNSGELIVTVRTRPRLKRGHTIQVLVSGVEPGPRSRNKTVTVSGVFVGPHTISAKIFDRKGKMLSSSNEISIHVRHINPSNRKSSPGTNFAPTAPAAPQAN